jgi:signal transduction histidine kinase
MYVQVKMVEAKTTFTRYMSHELRTPLNSLSLGLLLLATELGQNDNPRDKELLETVADLEISVTNAIGFLDGLMTYDKIESELLELHCQDVPVIAFLEECMKPLYPQARQSRVHMRLTTTSSVTEDEFDLLSNTNDTVNTSPLGDDNRK